MKLFKRTLLVLCLLFVGVLATSCDGFSKKTADEEYSGLYLESVEDYQVYLIDDLDYVLKTLESQVSSELFEECAAAHAAGVKAIEATSTVSAAQEAYAAAKNAIAECIPLANGVYTFSGRTSAEKTKILGVLEAYAVRNGITGISLFENGSYVMYNERITLGTETYIVGYGFGTLAEGSITADLDFEENAAWKRYYHTYNVSDPGTVNYLNDQGSEVGDFYGYFGASFFTNFMNETKDGYDWVPELAKEKPVAVDGLDENNQATKWRFEVRVGEELKYNTNSAIASRAAYNGREVELEDYLTPFKLLLTQSNALYRGSELANKTGSETFVGAKAFYDATAEGFDEKAWAGVGLRVYEEDGKSYFEFEFVNPVTQFDAMYYISSSLYMPIPQSFLDLVSVEYYLGYNADKTESPVDNSLSLGAYTLERWDSQQQVVYKKNPYYVYADTKYSVQGIHINILPGASEDENLGIKEFLAGHIDAAGIPQDYLDQYKSDPRTRQTKGSSNFKLNVNACDAETWEALFGVNGKVTQTDTADYWTVEPALSNEHFVRALSYSINRLEYASDRGSVPSVDYLSSNYMSDNENGISYSATEEHAAAVERLLENTTYGYNVELAREYFRVALDELEASGAYTRGTRENPTVIELEIAWMYPQHERNYHNAIKKYFEDAFNHESVSHGQYRLSCKFWVGNEWSDVYYDKLMLGQYDLGFGSISGNALNPLNFLSVLSSDQSISGNFTLNWGTDTNDPEADILVFEGERWSFDALWTAGNGTALVENGANAPAFSPEYEIVADADEEAKVLTLTITYDPHAVSGCEFLIEDVVLYGYHTALANANYYEYSLVTDAQDEGTSCEIVQDAETGVYTITIVLPAAEFAWICEAAIDAGYAGLDLYVNQVIAGKESGVDYYASLTPEFPYWGE